MESINNLIYEIKINYINESGLNVSVYKKVCENGLEANSIQIGDVCVTEETINGRVLAGRLDTQESYCGYRYNYERSDSKYLTPINENVLIETASSMINKVKMETSFLSARMVLSSILRNDYRVCCLNQGALDVTRTVYAENDSSKKYLFHENSFLTKLAGEESFSQNQKEKFFMIDDNVLDLSDGYVSEKIKEVIKALEEIAHQNPSGYKELIDLKNNSQMGTQTPGL